MHAGAPADRGTASIAHPLNAIDPQSAAVLHDRGAEQFYHLPDGTLDNRATIVSANAQQVCVRVELSRGVNPGVTNDHELAALGKWQLVLRGAGTRTASYTVGDAKLATTAYDGQTTTAENRGTTLECKSFDVQGNCSDAEWVRHWQVERSAARFEITKGDTRACFTNVGVLAPASRSLALELTVPGASRPAIVFEWTFDRG